MIMTITTDYLAQYTFLESELKRIDRKLKYYEKNPLQTTHGVVKTSSKDGLFRESHLVVSAPNIKSDEERNNQIKQLIITLNANNKLYKDMQLDIECFIETLTDLEMKDILTKKYIENMTYEQIGNELGYDRTTVSKKIDKFFQNK